MDKDTAYEKDEQRHTCQTHERSKVAPAIENVFTKVIRVSNLEKLGDHIVVQGGTFLNDAVLRAFEQYVGQEVTRAPYPGLMGAIGVALIARESEQANRTSTFIGWDALESFSYSQETNLICPFCSNRCNRTRITFSNGTSWITGNRCTKGEIDGEMLGKPYSADHAREMLGRLSGRTHEVITGVSVLRISVSSFSEFERFGSDVVITFPSRIMV